VRASDEDRQRVIDSLQRHTAAGRLTLDEFSERVGAVVSARTLQDLAATTVDLPAEEPTPTDSGDPHAANARQLAIAFAVAVLAIALLAVVYTLATR
jgi:hypothetical protein